MGAKVTTRRPKNLPREFDERGLRALKAAMEDTLFKQKEVAPVAFASAQSDYGWPLSFQAATAKPEGAIQGGTMKHSITAELDARAKKAVFRAQVKYSVYVHEGTLYINGRPFMTRPIKEVGIPALRDALREEYKKPIAH